MEIIEHRLNEDFYISNVTQKTKICLVGSGLKGLNHIQRLKNNQDKTIKQAPMFTVLRDGGVYKHFDPCFYSEYFDDSMLDKSVISVVLENLGPLIYDFDNSRFVNLFNIEVPKDETFEQEYREFRYWHKYTDVQIESVIDLCSRLCVENNVKNKIIGHIFSMSENIYDYSGIFFKANIDSKHIDINPSINFKAFYKNNTFLK